MTNLRARVVPRTLTSRLVVTAVAMVALVSVLIALVNTFAMNQYLTGRLDEQIGQTGARAGRVPDDSPDGGPDDPGGRLPFNVGTLLIETRGGVTIGGVVSEETPYYRAVSTPTLKALSRTPEDGHAHPISLGRLGDYRVIVKTDQPGHQVIVGLPTQEIHRTLASLLLRSLLLALAGVALAALIGQLLVRRQLGPLRQVAATAYDVSSMPLGASGQTIEARVPTELTDENTEVGQVGSALNTLLDHVDEALEARHRSEQQVRQFVADASHELRTPLSTIHGYAELSRRTPDDAGALSSAMAKVETEATRMSSLVGDLLLLARLDSGRPLEREEVDVTRLLLEAVADINVVAPDHTWRLELPDEPVTVVGDEQRLHQVVTNLINNARRHTPEGTTVTVTAARTGDGPAQVTVHDDGPGIGTDMVGRVFERFTRGDSSRTRASGGAGLGLSLVQAIAEAHGGTASVESRPGSTTFTLTLPGAS